MSEAAAPQIKNIVIVGGGSAGWMTAAALSSLLNPRSVNITLIESEQIGTVGVGEATIPDIINFNALLGIREADFLKATKGTFKLGIEFIDWARKGESYFHPFGVHGADMQGIDFHQYWLSLNRKGDTRALEDFSMCAVAAKSNKFALPDGNPRSALSQLRYAYHFDATGYASFLHSYAEDRGVTRIEGKVLDVQQAPETGFISSLQLEDGQVIEGDMFFDCTGFRALLMEKVLQVSHKDWSHWLPCNTAQAVACEQTGELLPYTKSTAKTAGWQWRIPTQTRTGNGHIYCDEFISDDEAINSLLSDLDGPAMGSPREIKFRTGCRSKFWEKNCIAIGLSGGFLEPLESTSLFLIQEGISKFITMFPTADMPGIVQDEYNRQLTQKFEQVRDFIILHYKATERDDSPFWNYCREMSIPDSLTHKIDLFQEAGRAFRYEDELFSKTSWIAVMIGQNIYPRSVDPIVASLPAEDISRSLNSMQTAMTKAATAVPKHSDFIDKYLQSGQARQPMMMR